MGHFLPIFAFFADFFKKKFAFFLRFFAIFRKKGTILKKRHPSNKNRFSMGAFFGTFFSKIVSFFRNFQFLQCLFYEISGKKWLKILIYFLYK
tara:strand:+ start:711 stop:989 length:279 start_codon:yes stop_codon:yes gene_type:complete